MKQHKLLAIASVSTIFVFFLTYLFEGRKYDEIALFSTAFIPLISGYYFSMTEKDENKGDILASSFYFVLYTLIFTIVLFFLLRNFFYPDVIIPICYFYIMFSPLFFLGGFISKQKFFIQVLIFFFLITIIFLTPFGKFVVLGLPYIPILILVVIYLLRILRK